MVRRQLLTPVTTWHTQTGLLLISATWGLSYLIPTRDRIPFAEVFPPSLEQGTSLPIWVWGVFMLVFASIALVAEHLIIRSDGEHSMAWRCAWIAHAILAIVYCTLAMAALVTGSLQVHTLDQLCTAVSRPVLWGYIGYLHITFANLRKPRYAEYPPPEGIQPTDSVVE